MNEVFRKLKQAEEATNDEKDKPKFEIPTHDPQTGEINTLYEELTGKKNPLKP